jgi:hypothetical protein
MVGRFPLGRTSHSGVIVKIDKNYFALPRKVHLASIRHCVSATNWGSGLLGKAVY